MALQPDGKILVAGGSDGDIAVVRYLGDESPPPPCDLPWGVLARFAILYDPETCTIVPEPCVLWQCKEPAEIRLIPDQPCLTCGLNLHVPAEGLWQLDFSIPELALTPTTLPQTVALTMLTFDGQVLSQAVPVLLPPDATNTPQAGLRLQTTLPAGGYRLAVKLLDEAVAKPLREDPKKFPFVFQIRRPQ